jgi:hypothetical protein
MFWLAKYGSAATFYGVKLLDSTTKNFRNNPTLATGDAKISKDGGALANLATLPFTTGGRGVTVSLSASEMQCKQADIQLIDAAGSEWDDNSLIIHTYGDPLAKFPFDFDQVTIGLNASSQTAIIDGILRTALTEGYAADGADPTLEQLVFMLFSALAQFSIAGTALITKKLDGSTNAMVFELNDSLNPTSRTRTS